MRAVFGSILLAASLVTFSASAQSAPDVVRLKNGGLYRGTISELVPDSHVEIVLVGGGTKRIVFAEIEYAGPDKAQAAAPAGGPAPGVATAEGSEIAFRGDGDLTLHQVTGSSYGVLTGYRVSAVSEAHSFRTLCTAPCTVALAQGTYEFALSRGDGKPVIASRIAVPAGPATLRGDYVSRAGIRAAGYVVLIGGVTTGVVLMLYPLFSAAESCDNSGVCTRDVDLTMLWVGLGVTVGSSIVGTILASRPDKATVELVPGVAGWSAPKLASLPLRTEGAVTPEIAQGLSLRARF